MQKLFTSTATAVGGRQGSVASESGTYELKLGMPMPGVDMTGKTTPEELFAGAYAACFDSAMNIAAMQKRIQLAGSEITSHVSLNKGAEGYAISVEMNITIKGVDQKTAEIIVEEGHKVCPFSNAIRNNVEVTFNVKAE